MERLSSDDTGPVSLGRLCVVLMIFAGSPAFGQTPGSTIGDGASSQRELIYSISLSACFPTVPPSNPLQILQPQYFERTRHFLYFLVDETLCLQYYRSLSIPLCKSRKLSCGIRRLLSYFCIRGGSATYLTVERRGYGRAIRLCA